MKKYHIAYKFLAILLCACALLTGIAGAISVYAVADQGLYAYSVDELRYQSTYRELTGLAENLSIRYAMKKLSNCPEGFIDAYAGSGLFGAAAALSGVKKIVGVEENAASAEEVFFAFNCIFAYLFLHTVAGITN